MGFEDPLAIAEKLQALPPYSTHISADGTRLYFVHNNEISCVFTNRNKPWTDKTEEELAKFISQFINPKPRKK